MSFRVNSALFLPLTFLYWWQIFTNRWSFVALCNDGTVVAGGDGNGYDQGGDTSAVKSELAGCNVTTIASAEQSHVALCKDGSMVGWGFTNV